VTWKQGFVLEPIWLDENHISCHVIFAPPFCSWMILCVYAPPSIRVTMFFGPN
jgi:hypothetical protein